MLVMGQVSSKIGVSLLAENWEEQIEQVKPTAATKSKEDKAEAEVDDAGWQFQVSDSLNARGSQQNVESQHSWFNWHTATDEW